MIPQAVSDWLQSNGFGQVASSRGLDGGCINNGARLYTASGKSFFLKTNPNLPPDAFDREAEGLKALRTADGPRLPQALLAGRSFLLLEDLNPGPKKADFWTTFGQELAALHNHTSPRFGFSSDNYLGSTLQPNPWMEDGYAFFAEHRLGHQARLAQSNQLLDRAELRKVERLGDRLPELVPYQPASLLHGDLWSGNVISDQEGRPAIIDPAAHYGWAEAELGMTALFGGFPEMFYSAYQEVRPLAPGWRERLDIYNLYQLLNHLNLFGASYYSDVTAILHRYG